MKYKAALFDMDGTLIDSLEDMMDSVNATLSHFSMPQISYEQTRCYVGNGARRLIEQAVPAGTDSRLFEQVYNYYLGYYNTHAGIKTHPYEGIIPMLSALKNAGMKLAVISNKPDATVRELTPVFFDGLFELSVGESPSVRRKPAPDTVYAAINAMGLEKSECVYIGDSEVDVATAKNAGVDCIAVTWGFRTVQTLLDAGAETLINTVPELEKKLLSDEG